MSPPDPSPNLQDQLISDLLSALTSRRTSATYSTSFHFNEQVLMLATTLLDTSNSTLTTLLRRIISNATWFQSHYRASLATLQGLHVQPGSSISSAVAERKRFASIFERDPGVRLAVGAMMEGQGARQERELSVIAASRLGLSEPLRSHPVWCQKEAEQRQGQSQELRFCLTPPDGLVLRLEAELELQERQRASRGTVIEGVDEDMILKFWEANPKI